MNYTSSKRGHTSHHSEAFVVVSFFMFMLLLMSCGTVNSVFVPNSTSFMASAKSAITDSTGRSSSHGGAVPLITLDSGNAELDHQINQFFKCIKKTGHTGGANGEPSREEVDTCYHAVFISGGFPSSNFGTESDHTHSSHSRRSNTDIFVS